jgi:hypothetical protein
MSGKAVPFRAGLTERGGLASFLFLNAPERQSLSAHRAAKPNKASRSIWVRHNESLPLLTEGFLLN